MRDPVSIEEFEEAQELEDAEAFDCECDAPDPDDNDEPWVPVICGNCGGRL